MGFRFEAASIAEIHEKIQKGGRRRDSPVFLNSNCRFRRSPSLKAKKTQIARPFETIAARAAATS
jgi:hypothetical protein